MKDKPQTLLSAFVSWASAQQQELLHRASPYVTKLEVGKATNNRAVTFTVERLRVEPGGWISDEFEDGGTLTVWENGCADAEWATYSYVDGAIIEPRYQEHWDNLDLKVIEVAFKSFSARVEGL